MDSCREIIVESLKNLCYRNHPASASSLYSTSTLWKRKGNTVGDFVSKRQKTFIVSISDPKCWQLLQFYVFWSFEVLIFLFSSFGNGNAGERVEGSNPRLRGTQPLGRRPNQRLQLSHGREWGALRLPFLPVLSPREGSWAYRGCHGTRCEDQSGKDKYKTYPAVHATNGTRFETNVFTCVWINA
jgi:hypothetical protein